MDRRKFLSAATILGSSGIIASSSEDRYPVATISIPTAIAIHQFEVDADYTPKVGIVAIGNAGGWVLSSLNGKLPRLFRSIAVDTNQLNRQGRSPGSAGEAVEV